MKNKLYEFNGVIEYAHCFSFMIEAKSVEEAKKKADKELNRHINSSNAEYSSHIIDEPILIEE